MIRAFFIICEGCGHRWKEELFYLLEGAGYTQYFCPQCHRGAIGRIRYLWDECFISNRLETLRDLADKGASTCELRVIPATDEKGRT